jgi:hypothetical protein
MYCGNTILASPSSYLSSLDMTAIALVPTVYGFAIAADGRTLWEGDPADEIGIKGQTENEQKVFKGQFKGKDFAYAVTGLIFNSGRTFNLIAEAETAFGLLSGTKNIHQYIKRFSRLVAKAIDNAKKDGRIDSYLEKGEGEEKRNIAKIFLAGYFTKNVPAIAMVHFVHDNQRIADAATLFEENPQNVYTIGSPKITDLFARADQRVAQYPKFADRRRSLEDAVAFSKGYVDACSGKLAEEIDPACKAIGGHTHLATVTKDNGFQWVIPPFIAEPRITP